MKVCYSKVRQQDVYVLELHETYEYDFWEGEPYRAFQRYKVDENPADHPLNTKKEANIQEKRLWAEMKEKFAIPEGAVVVFASQGPACEECGIPMRTPRAKLCVECGHWHDSENEAFKQLLKERDQNFEKEGSDVHADNKQCDTGTQ